MNRFRRAWASFWFKPNKATEESVRCRALQKHIDTLSEHINSQDALIRELSSRSRKLEKQSTEQMLIEEGIKWFSKNRMQQKGVGTTPTPIPLNVELDDDKIMDILLTIPENVRKKIPKYPDETIQAAIREQGYNVSLETVKRVKELCPLIEVNNG